MGLRPRPAKWFEVVVPREDADDAMEALVRLGRMQFEGSLDQDVAAELATLRRCVARYRALAADYAHLWPNPVFEKRCCVLPLQESARVALHGIEDWHAQAAGRLEELGRLLREQAELLWWEPILKDLDSSGLDLGALAGAGPVLRGVCLSLDPARAVALPGLLLQHELQSAGRRVLLGLAPRRDLEDLCQQISAAGGTCLDLPEWFEPGAAASRARLLRRYDALTDHIRRLEDELRQLAKREGVHRAAGVLERIDWFCHNAEHIHCDADHCWIAGWTSEADVDAMNRALQEVGVRATLSLREPPADAAIPSISRNPLWLEAFEVFPRAIGIPAITEPDPTVWVAFLVPLMFGYMCGDVGHGAVIFLVGILVRARTRLWPLLVFAGAAAMAFGFVYGEIFGYGHWIDPLWVRPLQEPLTVLLAPVLFGAVVLSVGVVLHLVGSCWRGQGRYEGVADAAQLLVQWAVILAFADPRFGWLAVAGALLCGANRLWVARSPLALLAGLGSLIHSSFELLLNTLSFIRVGAFALAHAALQSAVFALADAVSHPAVTVLVLVLGNLVVIFVEGVMVSIQTTRLVLFEFFIRFFQGRGREFRPADLPPGGEQ